ncbi:MAG: EAL domain-containing protein [Cyanobacteria bacterium P01_G01_bin.49]
MTKPFQLEEVLVRIKNHLELQTAKAEIIQLNAQLEQKVQRRTAQLETTNQQLKGEIANHLQTQTLLRNSEQRLESILNSLEEVVWSANAKTFEWLYLNPAAQKLYGRPVQEFFEQPNLWLDIVHQEDKEQVKKSVLCLLKSGNLDLEYRILRPNQEIIWVKMRGYAIYNTEGIIIRFDGIIQDITARKQVEEQLLYDALHDSLTGLPNRTLFMERIEMAIKQTKRHRNYLFAVLFIDLDRFKIINDSLGHLVGDQLLIKSANLLQECLRETDMVARLGGDEFTIFLDSICDLSDATKIAERIQTQFSRPFTFDGHQVVTSASIGIVLSSTIYESASELLRDADIAMYRAKEGGKARYEVFDQEMYAQTIQLLQLESELRRAIENQEFLVDYQPIVSLLTGKVTSFEALVRWQHPERGLIFPAEFISVAEDTGLIVTLGEWVLMSACQQLRQWQQQFSWAKNLKISVNLASQQISDPNFLNKLDQILRETGLEGNCLRLEITESLLIEHEKTTMNQFNEISKRNIQLSLDDFGTGYSSLSYLHRFPINTVKIDRSFINRMTCETESFEIVRTIITLAHTLGMTVTAEGVETEQQIAQLKILGCEESQGYFFSKPVDSLSVKSLNLLQSNDQLQQLH